jgi:hypothetical protein
MASYDDEGAGRGCKPVASLTPQRCLPAPSTPGGGGEFAVDGPKLPPSLSRVWGAAAAAEQREQKIEQALGSLPLTDDARSEVRRPLSSIQSSSASRFTAGAAVSGRTPYGEPSRLDTDGTRALRTRKKPAGASWAVQLNEHIAERGEIVSALLRGSASRAKSKFGQACERYEPPSRGSPARTSTNERLGSRTAHGNGTAFSAVAPSERPVLPSIDPIFGSGIPPGPNGHPTFHFLIRFRPVLPFSWANLHCLNV